MLAVCDFVLFATSKLVVMAFLPAADRIRVGCMMNFIFSHQASIPITCTRRFFLQMELRCSIWSVDSPYSMLALCYL
jgi:hypothetical protein